MFPFLVHCAPHEIKTFLSFLGAIQYPLKAFSLSFEAGSNFSGKMLLTKSTFRI